MKDQYAIAKAALLNDYSLVSELLEGWIEKEDMATYYLKTWPLFIDYRLSDEYKKFVESHKDKFEIGAYQSSTNDDCGIEQDS